MKYRGPPPGRGPSFSFNRPRRLPRLDRVAFQVVRARKLSGLRRVPFRAGPGRDASGAQRREQGDEPFHPEVQHTGLAFRRIIRSRFERRKDRWPGPAPRCTSYLAPSAPGGLARRNTPPVPVTGIHALLAMATRAAAARSIGPGRWQTSGLNATSTQFSRNVIRDSRIT